MNHGKYVFAQSAGFLPKRTFDGIIEKYRGNRYVRHFTCWNQLLCMVLGQLSDRDSLRDLGAWYIFDRAYLDYRRLHRIGLCSAYSVIRAKSNLKSERMCPAGVDRATGVVCDRTGRLTGKGDLQVLSGQVAQDQILR